MPNLDLRSHKYSRQSPLLTPHSGYHWDGSDRRFFEGWYFRITLPTVGQTFAFMYSIEDPIGGKPYSGGSAQILGPDDQYLCRTFPNVHTFWSWGAPHGMGPLGLGHWGKHTAPQMPDWLPPDRFEQQVQEGYQGTATMHQGSLNDPTSARPTRWSYQTQPIYGWGNINQGQKASGGLLSFLPIFEPGWQIMMAHGLATGWVEWQGHRYDFTDAPAYTEKNWGGAFPEQWFWLNCNYFPQVPNLALTAAVGKRRVLGWPEAVGLIGIHYQGQFYEFAPWTADLEWQVDPWGQWWMAARCDRYAVEIWATCDRPGTALRAPTQQGLIYACRDTMHGHIRLRLKQLHRQGSTILLDTHSHCCGLETGGGPWRHPWHSVATAPIGTEFLPYLAT